MTTPNPTTKSQPQPGEQQRRECHKQLRHALQSCCVCRDMLIGHLHNC
jgi:hypothetical protein